MQSLAARVILLWGWRRALIAFMAGSFAVLVQAPFDFFAAGFVAFPVLVWLLDGVAASRPSGLRTGVVPAFATGWWFGFGYFLCGLWWIGQALLVEAESFAWALPLAVIGVPAIMAIFYGFAAVAARLVWSDGLGRIAALAFAFALAEWLRGFLFTGFPWNAIGYGAMPTPLAMQSVALVGMPGMNALAVFVFGCPALLAAKRHVAPAVVMAVALVAAHLGFGAWRLNAPAAPSERELAVRIVQPSIDLSEKWDAELQDRIFRITMDLSAQPAAPGATKPQFVLWPETAVPFLFSERPDALAAIGDFLDEGQLLLAGAVRSEGSSQGAGIRYTNSVVAIDAAGEIVDAVDKVHLVPFGEYIPFSDVLGRLGLEQLVAGPMNFAAGVERHAIELPGGARAMPFICYEVIFPDLVATDTVTADLIVNVTNDAWFGDTPGPYQHLRQAQVRAVETGLPLIRAANTGISGVIDERGRILDALAVGARGVIDLAIRLPSSKPATLLHPSAIGIGLAAACFAAAFATTLWDRRRSP